MKAAPLVVARTDQIVAVLCAADEPLSTATVAHLASSHGSTYTILSRLRRDGWALRIKVPADREVYWSATRQLREGVALVADAVEQMADAPG